MSTPRSRKPAKKVVHRSKRGGGKEVYVEIADLYIHYNNQDVNAAFKTLEWSLISQGTKIDRFKEMYNDKYNQSLINTVTYSILSKVLKNVIGIIC